MSGPLASWALTHTLATQPSERFVLSVLALRAKPDGTQASMSVDQLELATGYSRGAVRDALTVLRDLGDLLLVRRGNGRGQISHYRIRVRWCDQGEACHECATLHKAQLSTGVTSGNTPKGVSQQPLSETAGPKGVTQRPVSEKGVTETPKGVTETPKGVTERPPYGYGDGPPTGGTVTHPESTAALAPHGAAVEPGLSQATRNQLAAFYTENRRIKTTAALNGQASATAPTQLVSEPNPPARDPADVPDPAPQRFEPPHQAVAREPARKAKQRRGRRGREPPATCHRSPNQHRRRRSHHARPCRERTGPRSHPRHAQPLRPIHVRGADELPRPCLLRAGFVDGGRPPAGCRVAATPPRRRHRVRPWQPTLAARGTAACLTFPPATKEPPCPSHTPPQEHP